MACNRIQPRNRSFVFDSLEMKLSPGFLFGINSTIDYSDPNAPPEPNPGPYPGDDPPINYPTPVPGGPIGPGAFRF